ncbi:MAG TPA: helix-turn-helix domain-containing protein [Spirochaetia bacterium]|nr:helix-turn-helix domain-containing protein [Spirochaetia bacterium]
MESVTEKLQRLGLSPYESKAAVALLKRHPSNGYQVGKIAGIPVSKVYEVLARLKSKGVVTSDESVTPALYYPVPVDSLVERIKSDHDATLREVESDLKLISPIPEIDPSWNLMGYEAIMQKATRVLKGARTTAMVSVWRQEYQRFKSEVLAAEKRGVKVVVSAFGAVRTHGQLAIKMGGCGDTPGLSVSGDRDNNSTHRSHRERVHSPRSVEPDPHQRDRGGAIQGALQGE